MSYFRELPDVEYLSFLSDRQSSDQYIRVKNLFRKAKLRDDIKNPLVLFDKYSIPDGYRPDNVAEELYGSPEYDWVVLICAGITNIRDQWPISDSDVNRRSFEKYGEELYGIHHYETVEQKDSNGRTVLDGSKIVNNIIQIPYPSYATEILQSEIFSPPSLGIDTINYTVNGKLFIYDSTTVSKTEDYGLFSVELDSNVDYGGTWTYTLNLNSIQNIDNETVKDKISFIALDGYLKTININITISGENISLSTSINSTQQSYVTFYDNIINNYVTNTNITSIVTNYTNEIIENNRKREINVLRQRYLQQFIRDTRNIMTYKKSSQVIKDKNGNNIIKTENVRDSNTYGSTFYRPNPTGIIVNEIQ
jgi:VCBS repeat-containing protein